MTLTDATITKKVTSLRKKHGKVYAPLKYFRGLPTLGDVETRYKKMLKKDYGAFETDTKVKTRTKRTFVDESFSDSSPLVEKN